MITPDHLESRFVGIYTPKMSSCLKSARMMSSDGRRIFYRFRDIKSNRLVEELHRGIDGREIYFPEFIKMNDPFEGLPAKDNRAVDNQEIKALTPGLLRFAIEVVGGDGDPIQIVQRSSEEAYRIFHRIPFFHPDAFDTMRRHLRCVSFTEAVDSTVMWAHYGNAFSGLCIEYEQVETLSFENPYQLRKVQYVDVRPVVDQGGYLTFLIFCALVKNLLLFSSNTDFSWNRFIWSLGVYPLAPHVEGLVEKLVFHKSQDWSYERELRIYDFAEEGRYLPMEHLVVNSVIFGPRAEPSKIQEIKRKLAGKVRLKIAKFHPLEYRLIVSDM
jgi:hypothetical protein